jgi:hypothetical protein
VPLCSTVQYRRIPARAYSPTLSIRSFCRGPGGHHLDHDEEVGYRHEYRHHAGIGRRLRPYREVRLPAASGIHADVGAELIAAVSALQQ